MDTTEGSLLAAQAAQSAAVDARELLRELLELEQDRQQPPTFKSYALNVNTNPIEDIVDVDRAGGNVKSTAIINFDTAVTIFVGWGGRQPQASSQALRLQPRQFIVAPWIVDRVEISVDAGQAVPALPGAQLAVVRFKTVQQFIGGSI